MNVRTRFAPSPTGALHVGGARTALFSWMWARKNGGEFLLRIEDTDAARSQESHARGIIDAMQWLGIDFDGEPARQSQRAERHREMAESLRQSGAAYEDDGALRLKTPDGGETAFDDMVCGRLAVENKEMEDPVVLRADGAPTYIFASASDDILDGITHVVRGDDHVRNTQKQMHVYAALGAEPPRFAHLPMILDAEGARMSKRDAAADVLEYRHAGYLPQALFNYLARLSWSSDAEIFDAKFAAAHFDFGAVQRSPARFDEAKLRWTNAEHLRAMDSSGFRGALEAFATMRGEAAVSVAGLTSRALDLIQPRSETLDDALAHARYFIGRPVISSALRSARIAGESRDALSDLFRLLQEVSDASWGVDIIKTQMKDVMKQRGLKFPQIGMPFRAALTGREQSPDVAAVAEAVGKNETLARMREALQDDAGTADSG